MRLSEHQLMLRDTARKLMARHASPATVRALDSAQAYPYELYQAWVDAGLLALPFPEAHGGLGGDVLDVAVVGMEIAYVSADFFMAYANGVFCGLNILRKGTDAQRAHWLPRLMRGETRMAIAISEPDAGSDAGAMRTSAVPDGESWVINGQKLWITGAGARDALLNVYVRTDRQADHRKGTSLFLVENNTAGIETRKLDMLGRRCTGTYEVFFRDVRVSSDCVVGGVAGGWSCILAGLQIERVVAAAGNCGAAQAVVDIATAYAADRRQFGRPIGSNQAISHMLADMQTEVAAARALMWEAAGCVAQGETALREISMAKLFSSETYARVANMGMQVMGGAGYSMEFDMQRHFRDARAATIAAGTSQMQRTIIAGSMGLKEH